jgi:hypothetical protein
VCFRPFRQGLVRQVWLGLFLYGGVCCGRAGEVWHVVVRSGGVRYRR